MPASTDPWHEGSCHCGRVRFRARFRTERAIECNCSVCEKKGFLHAIVEQRDFELVAGEEFLTTYEFNTRTAKHRFCRVCGVHPFYTPRSHPDGVDVNVRCLDPEVQRGFSVERFDGRNWEENVASIR